MLYLAFIARQNAQPNKAQLFSLSIESDTHMFHWFVFLSVSEIPSDPIPKTLFSPFHSRAPRGSFRQPATSLAPFPLSQFGNLAVEQKEEYSLFSKLACNRGRSPRLSLRKVRLICWILYLLASNLSPKPTFYLRNWFWFLEQRHQHCHQHQGLLPFSPFLPLLSCLDSRSAGTFLSYP